VPSDRASAEITFGWAVEPARLSAASLTPVTVVPTHRLNPSQSRSPIASSVADRRRANQLLAQQPTAAHEAGVDHVATVLLEGSPVDALVRFVDEHRPDLFVLGARGLSATQHVFLGRVSDGVPQGARWSVVVVRPPTPKTPGRPP
jgi:nucleotide-binding universal stress UspA family protein